MDLWLDIGYVQLQDLDKMKPNGSGGGGGGAEDDDDTLAERLREQARQRRLQDLCKADVVLTTYQALRKEVSCVKHNVGLSLVRW